MTRPTTHPRGRVALVGRPNVGKSTLFNRLTGTRGAIVTAVAGTTRDVIGGVVEWQGRVFGLVDTGGIIGASMDPMQNAVAERVQRATSSVDLIVFVVDGTEGPVPADDEVAADLRRNGVPVIVAVNKTDDRRARDRLSEFHRFGFNPILEIAAEHGLGIGDLLDEVVRRLPDAPGQRTHPEADPDATDAAAEMRIAIVGRPNVGKSSLVNRLVGEDRVMVSEVPGTTRDAVDATFRWRHRELRVVDTAGIRRPGKVAHGGHVEAVSVVRARHAMAQADVAVLVIDASVGVTRRDAAIAGEAESAGCGLVIAANKWDLVRGQEGNFAKEFDLDARDALKFADYAPIVHLSALTGERTAQLLERIDEVGEARRRQVSTGELNRVMEAAVRQQAPTGEAKGNIKIKYAVQSGTAPPVFTLFTTRGARLHFSYERFLMNRLRDAFGFKGTPIRLKVRGR
ncbi:MAG: ribosome biogenesis GTPase Der [Acidobacteria bacterium]|nr:ribosome biogenesis GTPase Der [Acidobacteriota bacterium]